jgi:hypothetical protein
MSVNTLFQRTISVDGGGATSTFKDQWIQKKVSGVGRLYPFYPSFGVEEDRYKPEGVWRKQLSSSWEALISAQPAEKFDKAANFLA